MMQYKEHLIKNTIEEISENIFAQESSRARMKRGSTGNKYGVTFGKQYNDVTHYYRVGSANGKNAYNRVTGADKYTLGYFDVYLSAMLLEMFPQGHNNIFLSIAHPPDALPYRDMLVNVVGGLHRLIVHTSGGQQKVRFAVRNVITWDECSGGLLRAFNRPVGDYTMRDFNPMNLRNGQKIAHVDLGGNIGSVTTAIYDDGVIEPDFDDCKTFYLGIRDVYENAIAQLTSLYPNDFRKPPEPAWLEKFVQKQGIYELRGTERDFTQAYWNAVASIVNSLENIYLRDFDRMPDVSHITISGGGGGMLAEEIKQIFERNITLSEDFNKMHFANALGGMTLTQMALEDDRSLLQRASKYKDEPAFVVVDLGNDQGKGVMIYGA